ncbi:bifunctional DNA-binding transcriptional regulator/O6-methylguanine-DNA methyltransferase Ada [Pseudomonas sp. 5P_3.1_Bac2]|uniref:bifunctional DNA-binding transcriptional regulator/O6-methylguanine-DNA methyltransferase Ada n=1 Tax=Pseudomonas sp. 5P_3.1_Bac2 TaxID=2971617 RepID=UPI0021C5E604|nr:bifunctional DNA-binding transcriptional regulator/O6-methylguanine-DNA methyltransferase Ada [Pseudomonas sp. 5P_3.1_Bac2]MCU1718234.1 bifunctional DNA-binding transcriptional regulator/O6-methylguanine-DNA methyltransferase Ada [Pseudomonas sp. 5P_3.1_Bac2]
MLDPDRCWHAVCQRDVSQTDAFVFAVSSTGIYCRPDCPARRPLRSNVSFFADAAAASAAGFRPCRRCAPHGPSPAQQMDALVSAAVQLLDSAEPLSLSQLAVRIGLSASHLVRAFKQRTGLTPHAWQRARRRERAEQLLPAASSVLAASLASGLPDTRALHHAQQALAPHQLRQQAAGETLRYAIAPCALGQVLLAASSGGVCAVLFADTRQALESELQQRFAAAQLILDEEHLAPWLEQLLKQIAEPARAAQLPLDMRGTVFQQQIWQQLRLIPSGETRTYAQLAATVGSHPRAVARACASNPLGLIVPCHRVIASNGSLSGYRWGIARKQQLLAQEQQAKTAAREE